MVAFMPSSAAAADACSALANGSPGSHGRGQGVPRRHQGIDHRLVVRFGLAPPLDPFDRRGEHRDPIVVGELILTDRLRSELQEEGPVERSPRPADAGDQGHADGLQERSDVLRVARLQLRHDALHPPVHVDAMVRIADRGVEGGQVFLVLRDGLREGADPSHHVVVSDAHASPPAGGGGDVVAASPGPDLHAPQRSPGVRTGASHSAVSSSSSLRSVIEQPCISSDVM
jgi:hypothetical protein